MINVINPKNEYWTRIEEAPYYEISNFGRVRNYYYRRDQETNPNSRGRIRTLYDAKEYKQLQFAYIRNGSGSHLSIPKLVYKYFGVGYPDKDVRVHHIDGDYKNNNIENLYITTANEKVEDWQMEQFNLYAYDLITKIAMQHKQYYPKNKKISIDINDIIQVALINVWKNLNKLTENESLVNLCRRSVKFAYFKLKENEIREKGGSVYEWQKWCKNLKLREKLKQQEIENNI